MSFPTRHRLLPGLALVASLIALGYGTMRPDDAERVSPPPAPIVSAPAPPPPVTLAAPPSAVRSPEREATPRGVMPLPSKRGLRGRVFDEDTIAPIADANIMVHRQGSHDLAERMPMTTAADGTFVIEDIAPGRVMISAHAQGYVNRNVEVMARADSPPVEIGLSSGGTIMGRLVAADGTTPVSGMVEVSHLDLGFGTGTSTAPNGEFDLQDLAPGRYVLQGRAEGGTARRELVLARGQRMVGIVIVLTTGHSIRGVVTGLRPEQFRQTRISLNRDGEAGSALTDIPLDERGAFVIAGVPPGRVYVAADSEPRQVSKTVDMPADSDLTVNLDFPRGVRLSGRITRGGEPLPEVPVAPVPPLGVQPPVFNNGVMTSTEGTYVIEDVPPGKYTLMIGPFRSGPFEVSDDTVFDFDVPGGELSGRVLQTRGEPIMGAEVYIWPAEPVEGQRPRPFSSDDTGKFTLGGLEPGEFTLTVYKPGYEMHRKHISYDTSSKELTIRLREEPGVQLTARAAVSGAPLRQLIAIEVIGAGRGSLLRLQLDEDGKGYLPSALAGSTLRFMAPGQEPAVIDSWSGNRLDLEFQRAGAR
jgi:hypothetical protein